MTQETSSPVFEPEARAFGSVREDMIVFDALLDLKEKSSHESRFASRDPQDDTHGLLRIDRAFAPVVDEGKRSQEAADTWLPFLVPESSFIELQRGIGTIYARSDVGAHLQEGGTLVFVLAPHLTYADIPVAEGAAAQISPEIPRKQTSFIHRQVVLHELRHANDDGSVSKLKVVDDGLLLIGNVMQTLPDSVSGRDDRFKDFRDDMNGVVREELDDLIDRGNQIIWLADSSTEAKLDPVTGEYIVGRVTRKNAPLLYLYNARGADKVMVVPLTIEINPFQPDGSLVPHDVPFEFGEPQILHSREEVHDMKREQIDVINRIKRPGTPRFRYETVEELEARIGRKA